jgi:hypothetical protein
MPNQALETNSRPASPLESWKFGRAVHARPLRFRRQSLSFAFNHAALDSKERYNDEKPMRCKERSSRACARDNNHCYYGCDLAKFWPRGTLPGFHGRW